MTSPILIHGENTFKSLEALKKIISENRELDPEFVNGQKINIQNFLTDINTIPFLAEKRLIILQNFFSGKKKKLDIINEDKTSEKLMKELEKLPDFITLVIYEENPLDKRTSQTKKLLKITNVIESKKLTEKELIQWIKDYLKENKINASPIFPSMLIKHLGDFDQWRLKNELDKLKTFAQGATITPEMIKKIVPQAISITIFNFTEAFSNKKTKEAIKYIKNLLDSGEEAQYIFNMIIRQFRIFLQVKELHSQNLNEFEIGKKIGIHPYPVKLAIPQTKNFTFEELKKIYQKLIEIEIATKFGDIKTSANDNSEMATALEKFIIDFCSKH
jgi:DNA polymerase-3 subunit delta